MIYTGKHNSLDDLAETVRTATANLRQHQDEFDTIAVQGMSGVLVGVPVSMRLRKPLVIVRKPDDDSHHGRGRIINEAKLRKRVVFLDDFVSVGTTRERVKKAVYAKGGRMVAQYTYQAHDYTTVRDRWPA